MEKKMIHFVGFAFVIVIICILCNKDMAAAMLSLGLIAHTMLIAAYGQKMYHSINEKEPSVENMVSSPSAPAPAPAPALAPAFVEPYKGSIIEVLDNKDINISTKSMPTVTNNLSNFYGSRKVWDY